MTNNSSKARRREREKTQYFFLVEIIINSNLAKNKIGDLLIDKLYRAHIRLFFLCLFIELIAQTVLIVFCFKILGKYRLFLLFALRNHSFS